jgi:pyruvate formate lyase activating enzyme
MICPHQCRLDEGQTGFCRARKNTGGKIISSNYGLITSLALDPIEKKPLNRFYPGSKILSVGSFGCNLRCPFCQNYEISMASENDSIFQYISPEDLVSRAEESKIQGNIGIAFTYNEPLIGYEYVTDAAKLARSQGLETVLVTNGYINKEPLEKLLPHISALNIDLKSFSPDFYKRISGDIETVKQSIRIASAICHVEVTTLIIPGENDSIDEMRQLSGWLARVDPEIPLHITRFYPRYKMLEKMPPDETLIEQLADIAFESLKYVFA